MTATATIRVPRETHNILAEQARAQGISLSAMLTNLARRAKRDATFRAEREVTRREAAIPSVQAEEGEWEAVLADGID